MKNRVRYKRGWRTEVRWQLKWAALFAEPGYLVAWYTPNLPMYAQEIVQAYEKPIREAVAAREAQYGRSWHEAFVATAEGLNKLP